MENYRGVVQNIVMIGDGEYRVTFRAYNERDIEASFRENEDVPFTLYSMIVRQKENDLSLIPEGILTDCMNTLSDWLTSGEENLSVNILDDIDKRNIAKLANDIASLLADEGMFTISNEDENG